MPASATITDLLARWSHGEPGAVDDLAPLVYAELRRIARAYFRNERSDHTLEPTALVHEIYLELMQRPGFECLDRSRFYGLAACLMRRTLVDYSRRRAAEKRGGDLQRVPLEAAEQPSQFDDILALDDALKDLASRQAHLARIVELRFFGGLSIEKTARCLDVSPRSVGRQWRLAKAWLLGELRDARRISNPRVSCELMVP